MNPSLFVNKLIAKFCSDSISPSALTLTEDSRGYMMVRESGIPSDRCAQWYMVGKVGSIDDCAAAARNAGVRAFQYGKGTYSAGDCKTLDMHFTPEMWTQWQLNRTSPACPNHMGLPEEFHANPYYDVYALKPTTPPGGQ